MEDDSIEEDAIRWSCSSCLGSISQTRKPNRRQDSIHECSSNLRVSNNITTVSCRHGGLSAEYHDLDQPFLREFSKMSRTKSGLIYLKVRTLVDSEPLKSSRVLLKFLAGLGISVGKVNRNEIARVRSELFRVVSRNAVDLDNTMKEVYAELHESDDYRDMIPSLQGIARHGDEYVESWNTVYRDDIRAHVQQKFVRDPGIRTLEDLLTRIRTELSPAVRGYTVMSWYNQWSSTITEGYFMTNPSVVPTVRRIDKVDCFFEDVPVDLKVTYLPSGYLPQKRRELGTRDDSKVVEYVKQNPEDLVVWLYENQGEQRFSDSNRLFLVLIDEEDLEESWRLKADFDTLSREIGRYLGSRKGLPEVKWTYDGDRVSGTFRTYGDALFITG